jgi:hypothetical protein
LEDQNLPLLASRYVKFSGEGNGSKMLVDDVIKNYKKNISEIINLINDINDSNLFLQSDKYLPDTICHPIWTLGHLSISAQGISEEMSVKHWLDKKWIELYGQQSNPINNPSIYHEKSELINTLNDAIDRVEKRFSSLTKKELEGPMPDTRYHHIYPTLAHVITSILIEHTAEHIKMLLMWRYYLINN